MPNEQPPTARSGWAERARQLGRRFKRRLQVYRAVARHPRTPWHSKALLGVTVAYALMPFDLIPDWIPVLGYLDDVIILPLLVWLALRSVPSEVLAECEQQVEAIGTDGGDERAATEGPSGSDPADDTCSNAGTEGSQ